MAPIDSSVRNSAQDPIEHWYTGTDGPWLPSNVIPDTPRNRLPSKHMVSHSPAAFGNQYRQQSEAGSFHYGVPHSDSGYGTRRSVGNTSVYTADIPERDQDCQSLVSHIAEYQPFHGNNEVMQQQQDSQMDDTCYSTGLSDVSGHPCPRCKKSLKTQSELKKHYLRHTKPFVCQVQGCARTEGFSTTNDLDRHTRSKHPTVIPESASVRRFRCHVPGCKSKDKSWPRLDNFRSHLKRVHESYVSRGDQFEEMVKRAEFWETSSLMDQDLTPSVPLSDPSPPRVFEDDHATQMRAETNWRSIDPEISENSEDLIAPRPAYFENTAVSDCGMSPLPEAPEVPHGQTIQPADIFQAPRIEEMPPKLNSVLLAPVGNHEPISPASPPKSGSSAKAARQTVASAAAVDALKEVIKQVMSKPNSTNSSTDRMGIDVDMDCNPPSGKASPGSSASSPTNPAESPPSENCSEISQKEVFEVIRILQERGLTLQEDPSHSPPTILNPGSVASKKSEKKDTCSICKKFTGRPCELKKHMKRHERPYGCTFRTCRKIFGSKNDWKRHENSQHFQHEAWRCNESRPESEGPGPCARVYYRRQTFHEHLTKAHNITSKESLEKKYDKCRIGRSGQVRFWCGFCEKTVDLKKTGLDAWSERFDHIDDHFMGKRGFEKKGILDWSYVSGEQEGNLEAIGATASTDESETTPTSISDSEASESLKRKRPSTDSGGSSKPAKQAKTNAPREILVHCCQCNMPHNPRLDLTCMTCGDSHIFCSSCKRTEA